MNCLYCKGVFADWNTHRIFSGSRRDFICRSMLPIESVSYLPKPCHDVHLLVFCSMCHAGHRRLTQIPRLGHSYLNSKGRMIANPEQRASEQGDLVCQLMRLEHLHWLATFLLNGPFVCRTDTDADSVAQLSFRFAWPPPQMCARTVVSREFRSDTRAG